MSFWLPWARLNKAPIDAGTWASGYAKKLVVHTTETSRFIPDDDYYYGHRGYPHLTVERDGTAWQHMDLDAPARALKNAAGGVETNRGGAWQVENVGYSVDGDAALTDAQVVTLRRLVRDLVPEGLQMQALPAGAIPGSARVHAPQRMTADEWRRFGGVCGHRHVPENDHWDPGAFDLTRLLVSATPPSSEEDDMISFVKTEDGKVFAVAGLQAKYVNDPATIAALVAAGLAKDYTGRTITRDALLDAVSVVEA